MNGNLETIDQIKEDITDQTQEALTQEKDLTIDHSYAIIVINQDT